MTPFALPIRRPTAVAMFFLGIVLLGVIGWQRIPVELFPSLTGDELYVNFGRPGSEPLVIERELLMPLEARVSELPQVAESWAQIQGSMGSYRVRFERGSELKVRELEVRRLAAEIQREQPEGTFVSVSAQDTSFLSRFAMVLNVTGGDDINALHDLAEDRIAPRLLSVPGISQVLTGGGATRQVSVWVDPDRCAALGVTTSQVTEAVQRAVGRLRFVGSVEDELGRTPIVLDGRPRGLVSLASIRVAQDRPVLLRHVAEIEMGSGRRERVFRVNGEPAVGMVLFQEEGANLVRLGRELRAQVVRVREDMQPQGIDLVVGFDAAELVEEQIDRLQRLGLSGFLVALMVLFLFLRQWRAVAVVAVAVPVSLLAAIGLLYIGGQTLNLISLFGLAVAIGLLVDNSVVVYEAVQRQLEHGADADGAAIGGVQRTVRAIAGASATTAVVFLPLSMMTFEQALVRSLLFVVALAILLPLLASLTVAVGLVPLLAHRLAAPAALRRIERLKQRKQQLGGLVPPDRGRALFTGLVTAALRRPASLLVTVSLTVIVTVIIALPWVAVNSASQAPAESDEIQLSVRLPTSGSLDVSTGAFQRFEQALLAIEGVEQVDSMIQEDGGSLTIRLAEKDERPEDTDAARVRQAVRKVARELDGVQVLRPGGGECPEWRRGRPRRRRPVGARPGAGRDHPLRPRERAARSDGARDPGAPGVDRRDRRRLAVGAPRSRRDPSVAQSQRLRRLRPHSRSDPAGAQSGGA